MQVSNRVNIAVKNTRKYAKINLLLTFTLGFHVIDIYKISF